MSKKLNDNKAQKKILFNASGGANKFHRTKNSSQPATDEQLASLNVVTIPIATEPLEGLDYNFASEDDLSVLNNTTDIANQTTSENQSVDSSVLFFDSSSTDQTSEIGTTATTSLVDATTETSTAVGVATKSKTVATTSLLTNEQSSLTTIDSTVKSSTAFDSPSTESTSVQGTTTAETPSTTETKPGTIGTIGTTASSVYTLKTEYFTKTPEQQFTNVSTPTDSGKPSPVSEHRVENLTNMNKGNFISVGLIVGGVILLLLLAIVTFVILIYRRKKKKKLNPELTALCANDSFSNADLLTRDKLIRQANEILASREFAKRFASDFIGGSSEDTAREQEQAIAIRTCRQPQLKCLKHSQIHVRSMAKFTLHMNKLIDFFGDPIYLAQAPLKDEFVQFWQAIIQENIGLVVWVGQLSKGSNDESISAYIPLREHGSSKLSRYHVYCEKLSHSLYEGLDIYDLKATKHGGDEDSSFPRKIVFIHFHFWPTQPTTVQLSKLNKCLKNINLTHKRQLRCKLRGVLFHCSTGVDNSATLCAIYLCQQMWHAKGVVHVVGIMRYVRNYRHCAFSYRNEVYRHVRTVFGAMKAFVEENREKENELR